MKGIALFWLGELAKISMKSGRYERPLLLPLLS